ncbi:MAG: ArsR/SmtB family transcription factor [Candidatus Helarchaeota archaeon]
MEELENKVVNFLKILEKSVNEIQEELGEKQSTISQHLNKLASINVVTYRKEGQKSIYKIKNQDIFNILTKIINFISSETKESIDNLTSKNIIDTLS